MDYMSIVWTTFANSTFCQNYSHIEPEYLAHEGDILQLKNNVSNVESITFRALVRPAKVNRSIKTNFSKIFTSSIPNMRDAFALPLTMNGKKENLFVMKVEWDSYQISKFDELVAFSAINDRIIIWSDDSITDRLHEYIINTTEVYNEQLNLNDEAANGHCGLIQALEDLENIQHPIEPSLQELTECWQNQSILQCDNISYSEHQTPISVPTTSPHQIEPELQFTTTQRGGKCLIENLFTYTRHRVKGDIDQWQCIRRGICNARIHTRGMKVVSRINEHSHERNQHIFCCSKIKATIRDKASETRETTNDILTSSLKESEAESANHLPKLDSLKQTIRRARKRSSNLPPEPATVEVLEIPEMFKFTNKGERFLLFDSGAVSGYRVIIFGTNANVELLNSSNIWIADGTFKAAPSLFYHLYVIHALKRFPCPLEDQLLPCLFILLTHKSEDIYHIMWSEIKKLCPNSTPSHLIVDFERAAIDQFSFYYPTTQIKGCFFHLTQDFWRKIQEFGLATRYKQEPSFALQLRMIPALAFATPDDIPEMFNRLFAILPIESSELIQYFETTYIGKQIINPPTVFPPLFPIEMWNNHFMVQQGLPRIPNAIESWHRSFTSHMRCRHPSIWNFLEILKKEQDFVEVKQGFYRSGKKISKIKSNTYRENALTTLVDSYQPHHKLDFLKEIAYQFSLII